jgi:hypothetical protein
LRQLPLHWDICSTVRLMQIAYEAHNLR